MNARVWRMVGLALLAGLSTGCEHGDGLDAWSAATPAETQAASAAPGPEAGMPAPDFTRTDQHGKPFMLSDQRGRWVVLYFYPRVDTPDCTCQATEFTELLFRFQDMDATVIGVNAHSQAAHAQFTEKHKLGLRLLSDPDHAVMKRYGVSVADPAAAGERTILRQTFLIGPDGRIRYHWADVTAQGHAQRVADKLAELRAGAG